MNPYQVLGIEPGASPEEAKAAFRDAAKRYHPDVGGDTADPEKFQQALEAYEAIAQGRAGYADPFGPFRDVGNAATATASSFVDLSDLLERLKRDIWGETYGRRGGSNTPPPEPPKRGVMQYAFRDGTYTPGQAHKYEGACPDCRQIYRFEIAVRAQDVICQCPNCMKNRNDRRLKIQTEPVHP